MRYKKYICFCYEQYYPSGGLGDIEGSFDTLQEALTFMKTNYHDYKEIIDRDTWEEVWNAD